MFDATLRNEKLRIAALCNATYREASRRTAYINRQLKRNTKQIHAMHTT